MWFSPVSLALVTEAIAAIVRASCQGTFQLSAKQDISYLAAARHLAKILKAPETLVGAGSALRAGLSTNLTPRHTTLDSARAMAELGIAPPDAIETLDRLISEIAAR
jgi:dTDP-4-dehydrorhamnose reductase